MVWILDCWSFSSSWDLVSIRREKSRRAEVMWFHTQPLLLLAPDQPSAELAPMIFSSQTIFKMGFTKNSYLLKQKPSFHLKVLWHSLMHMKSLSTDVCKNTWKTENVIWVLLLPSLAKAVILLTHKSMTGMHMHRFLGSLYYTPCRGSVIYVLCTSILL